MNQTQQFHIYHCTGENAFQEIEEQPRQYVGFVEASSLESAYLFSQNFDIPWNLANACRSTSVGDVIVADDGAYMVMGQGFRLLDDLSKNDSELNSLESQSNEC
tara:strand:+ start:11324 stop:11635 length:312 start_codon:yes stop_codon:yes gene_type:complete